MGLQILLNLDHRGAVGADPKAGDGCGMLVQIPHRFFAEECAKLGFALPDAGGYAVGHLFLPRDADGRKLCEAHRREGRGRRGPDVPGLARRSGRQLRPRRKREADGTGAARRSSSRRGNGIADRMTSSAGCSSCARSSPTRSTTMKDQRTKAVLSRVAVLPHHRLQGHAAGRPARRVLPGPHRPAVRNRRSRSSTSGSRPTPSRPGRSRIPTGWSPTTARSTRCAAT